MAVDLGIDLAIAQGFFRLPNSLPLLYELMSIKNYGLDAAKYMRDELPPNPYPAQGRIGSRKKRRRLPTEIANEVAKQISDAG